MRALLFALFALSGFSGLIYETIWARYLGLFLGHAAYAQTLVLVIFMGGMGVGAWLAGRHGHRLRNLLFAYAVVELLIGFCGAAFHPVFVHAMGFAFDDVIPSLTAPWLVQAFQWCFAALLILPQSMLLGATFPLLSAALVRRFPQGSGSNIAMLYFVNSFGAATGSLVAGFAMLAAFGLPGTILSSGLVNVAVALAAWLVSRDQAWTSRAAAVRRSETSRHEEPNARSRRELGPFMPTIALGLAAVTGAASLMYEVGWMRMLALVMGASTHAFEIMLSAFIFGLAFGSLWIRRRIDGLRDPVHFLGCVQVLMGVLALGTLFIYGATFYWMSAILGVVTRTDAGYVVFNVASHAIALLVMVPATFCAGMTLPLITQLLLQRGEGEGSIGRVYAANTAGAIAGVVIAVHAVLPLVGLKGVLIVGAAMDIAIGIYILYRLTGARPPVRDPWTSHLRPWLCAAGVMALFAAGAIGELDPNKMASGVFRHGRVVQSGTDVLFHRDGKTATVDVVRYGASLLALRTNGKADASINMDENTARSTDEHTQVLLGALSIGSRPDAKRAAVVGFGSGLSTHVLLASPAIERVTTVEIEPVMIEGAKRFMPRVRRAFEDPRSEIRIEDAKTFFAHAGRKFDLIVSEPSNPWVSGVAGLFSREFYRVARRFLHPHGVFCQWLHTYEIDPTLVATVMSALQESFPHYEIYNTNDVDLLILASDRPIRVDVDRLLAMPEMAQELATVRLHNAEDLRALRIGSEALLGPMFRSFATTANSDYFPVLDLAAVRTRFLQTDAAAYDDLARADVPVIDILDPRAPKPNPITDVTDNRQVERVGRMRFAMAIRDFIDNPDFEASTVGFTAKGKRTLLSMLSGWERCGGSADDDFWIDNLLSLASMTVPYLSPQELETMWERLQKQSCNLDRSAARSAWLTLVRAVSRRDTAAMLTRSRRLLAEQVNIENERRLRYLVTVAMTAALANDDPETAMGIWLSDAGTRIQNEQTAPELRLLVAQAAERLILNDALATGS